MHAEPADCIQLHLPRSLAMRLQALTARDTFAANVLSDALASQKAEPQPTTPTTQSEE
jgi:hypothetical protein